MSALNFLHDIKCFGVAFNVFKWNSQNDCILDVTFSVEWPISNCVLRVHYLWYICLIIFCCDTLLISRKREFYMYILSNWFLPRFYVISSEVYFYWYWLLLYIKWVSKEMLNTDYWTDKGCFFASFRPFRDANRIFLFICEKMVKLFFFEIIAIFINSTFNKKNWNTNGNRFRKLSEQPTYLL